MVKPTIIALLMGTVTSQSLLRVSPGTVSSAYRPLSRMSVKPVQALPLESHGAAALEHEVPSGRAETSPQYNIGRRNALLSAAALGIPFGYAQNANAAGEIKLVTFDGSKEFKRQWLNRGGSMDEGGVPPDPKSKIKKEIQGKTEFMFDGRVPGEKDPIVAWTATARPFKDLSTCEGLSLTAKSGTEYSGYKLGIGTTGGYANGPYSFAYKAPFQAPLESYGTVNIPFADFGIKDAKILQDIKRISFWGEAEGKVDLDVKAISAYGCGASTLLTEVSAFDVAGGNNILWVFAAGTLGVLGFFVVRTRRASAPVAQPSLLG